MTFIIKSFDNEQELEEPKESYKIKSFEEEMPSWGEQIKNVPGIFGREVAAEIKGLPRSLSGAIKFGSKKLQELGEAQALEQGREIPEGGDPMTSAIVNILGKPNEWLEKLGLPTTDEARKALTGVISERYGINLPEEGRGKIEKFAQGAGAAVPYAAGMGPLGAVGTIGAGGISKSAELKPGAEIATNIGIPVLLELGNKIRTRRYAPSPGEAERLYHTGQQLGLTDEQMAPFLASEQQVGRYGRLAAGQPRVRRAFQHTNEALGNTLDTMQNRPQNFQRVSAQQEHRFLNELRNIEHDIRTRTPSLSPQETTHANFIRDAVSDIEQNGLTPRRAIGLWRSNNRIQLGGSELSRVRDPITRLLKDVDPQLAGEFADTNRMYQRFMNNMREINPTAFNAFIDAGEMQKLMGAIFSGSAETLGKQVLNYASLGTLKRLSGAMITNPHFQSLARKFRVAINSGSESAQRNLYRQLQEQIKKEYPEEYREITWPEISKKQQ